MKPVPSDPESRTPPSGGGRAGWVEPRDAATVILVRQGQAVRGLEVFMVRRHLASGFVGGFYVFPGGTVDPGDRDPVAERFCRNRTDADASQLVGVRSGGLGFWVAALRELFEEVGVLLAYRTGADTPLSFSDPNTSKRFAEYRRAVDADEMSMVELCRLENLELGSGDLYLWSHWLTPVGEPRRYDTRFFLAVHPTGQHPVHDDRELIAGRWGTPVEFLDQSRAGEISMILPTIATLNSLAEHDTVESLVTFAAAIGPITRIQPRLLTTFDDDNKPIVRIVLPGEPGWEEAAELEDRPSGRE